MRLNWFYLKVANGIVNASNAKTALRHSTPCMYLLLILNNYNYINKNNFPTNYSIACDGPDKDVYCKTCYGKKWGPHGM